MAERTEALAQSLATKLTVHELEKLRAIATRDVTWEGSRKLYFYQVYKGLERHGLCYVKRQGGDAMAPRYTAHIAPLGSQVLGFARKGRRDG